MYLQGSSLKEALSNGLIIRPLLDNNQIGQISIDFRLGYDFLVSIQGREPFIDTSMNSNGRKPIGTFFQPTRRKLGDTFILHPNQTVLATSLEFVKLPDDIFATLTMRSSYSRLGITISTFIQPGYCGCISLELTNLNKNPINLTVGSTIFQARFVKLNETVKYFNRPRKYLCQVRPKATVINDDDDLKTLHQIWKEINNIS